MSAPVVNVWGPATPGARTSYPPAPPPHDEWSLTGGTAWVYRSPLNRGTLARPVILSDGFSHGPSNLDQLWHGLEENGDHRFVSELRTIGRDVVVLGYDDRSASITDNADTAIDCIRRVLEERVGPARAVVGGFGTGGLVTRYALARMERDPDLPDHETSLYFSYDTPHRGAWLPVSLQAFVHFATDRFGETPVAGPALRRFSALLNSPAAKQTARWHIAKADDTPAQAPERQAFLRALEEVGEWPLAPRRIGGANGVSTGDGNGLRPDTTAVSCSGATLHGTWLRTQARGDQTVAGLRGTGEEPTPVRTSGLADLDGAPGGLFTAPSPGGAPGAFGLAAALMGLLGNTVDQDRLDASCFVPSISAVAAGDLKDPGALHRAIEPEHSDLDAFLCASRNEGHTAMTAELGTWIIDEILTAG